MINPCLLDTTIASFLLNRNPLIQYYRSHLEGATPVVSFQTVAEMRHGALKANWGPQKTELLEEFLQGMETVHSSDDLTRIWSELMQDAQRAGKRLEAADCWIAATAAFLDAPLLTHDKDFSPLACPSITVVNYALEPPT